MKLAIQLFAIAFASTSALAQTTAPFTCPSTEDPIGGCCGVWVEILGLQEGLGCKPLSSHIYILLLLEMP